MFVLFCVNLLRFYMYVGNFTASSDCGNKLKACGSEAIVIELSVP